MDQDRFLPILAGWLGTGTVNDQDLTLSNLRIRAFKSVLDSALILGIAAVVFIVYSNLVKGEGVFIVLTLCLYSILLGVRFLIPDRMHKWRVIIVLTSLTLVGLLLSFTKGTVGDGRIWLLLGPIIAILFLNLESSFFLLVVNMLGWFGVWYAFEIDLVPYPIDHLGLLITQENSSLWVNTGGVLFTSALVMVLAIALILNSLNYSLQTNKQLLEEIHLKEANRSRAEQALSLSEKRYRRLVDNSPYLIMEIDKEFQIKHINPAMRTSLGLKDEALDEIDLAKILPKQVYEDRFQKFQKAITENRLITFEDQRKGRIFENVFVPSRDLQSVQLIAIDITEYKRIQKELLQYQEQLEDLVQERTRELKQEMMERKRAEDSARASQRLADIGLLTTGVAHELNSPLQAILSNTEMTQLQLQKTGRLNPESLSEILDTIRNDVIRCSRIIQPLQSYTHQHQLNHQETDLEQLVEDVLQCTAHEFMGLDRIEIQTQIPKDLPPLLCEKDQLERALINLILNARDALPDGGQIHIRVDHDPDQQQFSIQVEDNGTGIPDELQSEIFKPFFTTKDVGKGTGLGLYLVSGIVEAHGGEITFSSQPGSGTCFTIFLPDRPPDVPAPTIKGRYGDLL